jgi:catechol 2,3-dioxygenase-like lactoylglutathione lyase family enzyme
VGLPKNSDCYTGKIRAGEKSKKGMNIKILDHLVLTVADIESSVAFYADLGLSKSVSSQGRVALHYGTQKINLHLAGAEFSPCALHPKPGSADLCFIVDQPIGEIVAELESRSIPIIAGPVERTGARGRMESVYIRDPDGNLLEIARYREPATG